MRLRRHPSSAFRLPPSAFPMTVKIGTLTLYDSTAGDGSALSGLDGTISRMVEVAAYLRGVQVLAIARGNRRTELSFAISRPQSTADAALGALFEHEAEIPVGSSLVITRDDGATITIPGELQSVHARHLGSRTFHDYRFTGGLPDIALPGARLTDDGGKRLTDDGGNRIL